MKQNINENSAKLKMRSYTIVLIVQYRAVYSILNRTILTINLLSLRTYPIT